MANLEKAFAKAERAKVRINHRVDGRLESLANELEAKVARHLRRDPQEDVVRIPVNDMQGADLINMSGYKHLHEVCAKNNWKIDVRFFMLALGKFPRLKIPDGGEVQIHLKQPYSASYHYGILNPSYAGPQHDGILNPSYAAPRHKLPPPSGL